MTRTTDRNAALLSLLWPGLGQFFQRRILAGALFATWTLASAIATFTAPTTEARRFMLAEMAVVALWAIGDAYLRSGNGQRDARRS